MKPLVYKGLRKNLNRSEWVSSDEIKQSYSQIRLLAVENDTYAWVPIEDGTLCRGSEAKDTLGKRIYEKDHIEFDCKFNTRHTNSWGKYITALINTNGDARQLTSRTQHNVMRY